MLGLSRDAVLAVAALSARAIVESAARDGTPCVALDVFGDADTRRAAARWISIGEPSALRIDGERLLAALATSAREGATGWVVGSGFEGQPELLQAGARLLPLLGTAGTDVCRLRDPRTFFDFVRVSGIAHPPTRFTAPDTSDPWLQKNGGGCGGWQVHRVADGEPCGGSSSRSGFGGRIEPPWRAAAARRLGALYWQLEREGPAMSATFVANGEDAVVLGFNRQHVHAIGERPFVFAGVVGPVVPSEAMQRSISDAVRRLAAQFRVRGLGSLDFVLHGDTAEVIELNPRPPASLALYPRVGAAGPLHAHRRACLQGVLPPAPALGDVVRGIEFVFAPSALRLDAAAAELIACWPGAHDLPHAGSAFMPGDPLCSVSASGADAAQVQAALTQRREALLQSLERA